MMKTLGQCSEPSPDLRVPLLQCGDKQHLRFVQRTHWKCFSLEVSGLVSHFQEPPGAEKDEEPVPKLQQEFCHLKPLFLHMSQQCCFAQLHSKVNRLLELTVDGDGCCL